jgi:hypothetical protein
MHTRIVVFVFVFVYLFCLLQLSAQNSSYFISELTIPPYQYNDPESILMTDDSNYVVAGYLFNGAQNRSYLIKLDKYGQLIWSKQYGDATNNIIVHDVAKADQNGYMMTAWIDSLSITGCMAMIKVDSNGTMLWSKKYRDIQYIEWGANVIRPTFDGGYIMTGAKVGNSYSMTAVKTDSLGTIEWVRNYCIGANKDRAYDIQQLPDSGYVLCGKSTEFNPQNAAVEAIYVLRIDKKGVPIWGKGFGSLGAYPYELKIAPDGNIVVVGFSYGSAFGDSDIALLKLDTSGNLLWMHVYGTSLNEIGQSFDMLPNGNFVISGVYSSQSQQRGLILLADSMGNFLTAKEYPTINLLSADLVATTLDGDILLAGIIFDSLSHYKSVFIKTPPSGDVHCGVMQLSFGDSLLIPVEMTGYTTDSSGYAYPGIEKYDNPISVSMIFLCSSNSNFYATNASVCENSLTTFINLSDSTSTAYWYVNQVLVDSTFDLNYTFTSPGTQTIMLVSQPSGDTSQLLITVFPAPTVVLNLPDTICNDLQYIGITPYASPPGGTFTTIFGVGDTILFPPSMQIGYSLVTYSYTDLFGCSAIITDSIYIDTCSVFIGIESHNQTGVFPFFYSQQEHVLKFTFASSDFHYITIFNNIGQQVYIGNMTGRTGEIMLPNLATGFYVVTVVSNGISQTGRFVKMD